MAKDLAELTSEEEYNAEDRSLYDVPESVDTSAATKGSDLASSGIAMNAQAGHSTVVIRSFSGSPAKERDIPELLAETASAETEGSIEPATPPQGSSDTTESPPAYTASVRSSRRSSYAARNNVVTGTVLGEADLGTGVDTIRPVKKVDTIRSLRLSSGYVGSGSLRSKEGMESSPTSPSSPGTAGSSGSGKAHKRGASEVAKAGKAMVDEVLLPIFEKVRVDFWRLCFTLFRFVLLGHRVAALNCCACPFAALRYMNDVLFIRFLLSWYFPLDTRLEFMQFRSILGFGFLIRSNHEYSLILDL